MADLSDVTALLAQLANAAVYPNGTGSPSVAGVGVRIFEGWPIASQLDADLAAGMVNVSVFPWPNATAQTFQILDDPYIVTPPVHGMSAAIVNGTVTVSGAPGSGEYLTIIADRRYAYSRVGASVAAILAAIQADASANYAGVTVNGSAITLPTDDLAVHIGAPATAAQATHRQKDAIMVTVWAPTNALRNTVAAAVDVALKATNHVTFPDTSMGTLAFMHSAQHDNHTQASIYRRDLVYSVEYATLQTFPVFEITSFNPTIDGGPADGSAAAVFANG